jgi:hypothetical protein
MAESAGVNIVGWDEFRVGSAELFAAISKRADKELLAVARQRAGMVAATVPRVTGRLAASVTADPYADGSMVGIGDERTPYAGWIEFGGTRGRPYVPEGRYLYPIALAAGELVDRDLTTATKQEIRSFHWPNPPTTA